MFPVSHTSETHSSADISLVKKKPISLSSLKTGQVPLLLSKPHGAFLRGSSFLRGGLLLTGRCHHQNPGFISVLLLSGKGAGVLASVREAPASARISKRRKPPVVCTGPLPGLALVREKVSGCWCTALFTCECVCVCVSVNISVLHVTLYIHTCVRESAAVERLHPREQQA